MALYTFTCPDCGGAFDKVFVRVSAEPKIDCPSCGGVNAKRGFGLPAKSAVRESTSPMAACPPGTGPCGSFGCQRGS